MFKKFSLLIFIFATLLSSSMFGSFHKDSWDFMEYTFIEKPNNEKSKKRYKIIKMGIGLFGLKAGEIISKPICDNLIRKKTDFGFKPLETMNDLKRILYYSSRGLSIVGSGCLAYSLLNDFINNSIEFNIIKNFVASWPKNREYTPKDLHKSFDELYNLYKNEYKNFKQEANETFKLIQRRIFNQFPQKYKNNNSFFNFKLLNADFKFGLGNTLSGIADIIKSIRR